VITLRRSAERRHVRSWNQEIWKTFAPEDQEDQLAEGFGSCAALDELRLPPNAGAAPLPLRHSEIVTYVFEGALAQEDSTGRSGVVHVDEFQSMTTGRIRHSERNASQTKWTRVFRLSLRPSEAELDCGQEQRLFPLAERRGVLRVVASPDGRRGSLRVHADALVYSAILDVGHHLIHPLDPGRVAWLHVLHGKVALDGLVLVTGDGVGVAAEPAISCTAQEDSEILLVDMGGR
jgi:hypothetical protein